MKKTFIVEYVSRYYPYEGTKRRNIIASSKKEIRDNWHGIVGTDEYRIKKITEAVVCD